MPFSGLQMAGNRGVWTQTHEQLSRTSGELGRQAHAGLETRVAEEHLLDCTVSSNFAVMRSELVGNTGGRDVASLACCCFMQIMSCPLQGKARTERLQMKNEECSHGDG